ncbi:unnamed protein product [Aureobasidium uvarum]|uniref:Uncharacterized protein n=1 Tax=Aureobasidium uvarum TaxID=2773716 RepID=A0A9N8PW94_9PEZI|nr:unnamed protein product [Aureobasidium uvarum]
MEASTSTHENISNPPISHLATQDDAMKTATTSEKPVKRIIPEKIAEVGGWKAEPEGEVADEEDNADMATDGAKSG